MSAIPKTCGMLLLIIILMGINAAMELDTEEWKRIGEKLMEVRKPALLLLHVFLVVFFLKFVHNCCIKKVAAIDDVELEEIVVEGEQDKQSTVESTV